MDQLYILAVTPAAGGVASIVACRDLVHLRIAIDTMSEFLLPGYDWSCAKLIAPSHTIPLTKSQVFDLLEEAEVSS